MKGQILEEELLQSAILFEIMIVIDAAAEVGLETYFRIPDMIWCMEKREGEILGRNGSK